MGRPIKKGSTDQSTVIRILDSTTFLPETAVTYETAGIDLWFRREKETKTSIAEATLAAVDSAHSDGGIIHIGDGYYRLDLPDAAVATGAGENEVVIGGTLTGMVVVGNSHPLVDYDPYDSVRMGMTSLPNAAADAAGGIPISDAGGLDLDAKLANTNEITAARMGALTDWINGGRLDLLLDALMADVGDASESALGSIYAILGNAAATLTSRTPSGTPGANNGAVTTNGTKINQTADLTAGQSIACSDKTGFALSSTGADLILKSSTFVQAIVAAVNEFATYGLTALNTLLVTTGIKTASTAAPADMALNSTVAKDATVAKAATALDKTVWTDTKAGYIDAAVSSASAPTASQVADAVLDELLSGHAISGSAGAALSAAGTAGDPWSGVITGSYVAGQAGYILDQIHDLLAVLYGGIGATAWTYTVTDDVTLLPVAGVEVWITTDLNGINKIAYGITNASGIATLYPNVSNGTTVYIWRNKSGVQFTDPDIEVVSFS